LRVYCYRVFRSVAEHLTIYNTPNAVRWTRVTTTTAVSRVRNVPGGPRSRERAGRQEQDRRDARTAYKCVFRVGARVRRTTNSGVCGLDATDVVRRSLSRNRSRRRYHLRATRERAPPQPSPSRANGLLGVYAPLTAIVSRFAYTCTPRTTLVAERSEKMPFAVSQ
jgi:hypothetical protein